MRLLRLAVPGARQGPRIQALALLCLWALAASCGQYPETPSPGPRASGKPLGALSLKTPDGAEVGFKPGTSTLTLLELWAPDWFEGSEEQFARLQEIEERFGGRGVRVLCVAYETRPEQVREAVSRHGALFDVGLADDRALEVLDPQALPTTWILDRVGRFLRKLEGYQPLQVLEKELEARLAPPEPSN